MNLVNSFDASIPKEYQDVVCEKENRFNSLNKLIVKRELISDALAKNKPKRNRNYSNMIDIPAKTIMDLPGNVAMSVTMDIAKKILQDRGEKVKPKQIMLRQRDHLPYLTK
jgi:hypothetical protein